MSEAEEVAERFNVSRESFGRLRVYETLLRTWNSRINLIGPKELDRLWPRHIADGLQVLRFLRPSDRIVADLGSGAGIPGLVVAMAGEGLTVHLIESNGKKAAFLKECVRATAANVTVHEGRIEQVAGTLKGVDVVTARALAPLPRLIEIARPLILEGARGLFHKGSRVEAELTESLKSVRLTFTRHPSLLGEGGSIVEVEENGRG